MVIKPNFVLDRHYDGGMIECVITQPGIIRAVCDYAYIALQGKGEIVIADAPQADCNFDNLLLNTKLQSITDFYKTNAGFDVPIYDLRQLKVESFIRSSTRHLQEGDPLGYEVIDVGGLSSFTGLENMSSIYGADYNRKETLKHHENGVHEYCVSRTILTSDVVISVPKMKVHRKAGITINLKNLVGINGNKNYLPHYRIGLPEDGGDEFLNLSKEQRKLLYKERHFKDILLSNPGRLKDAAYFGFLVWKKILRLIRPKYDTSKVVIAGNWYGNDTIWRTLLDLNKILIYYDKNGKLQSEPQRKFISIVDGIISGENEGPLVPTPKHCGVVACGFNPLITDIALARVMGFDPLKIPKIRAALSLEQLKLSSIGIEDIEIVSNNKSYENALTDEYNKFLCFVPPKGWIGSMEI